MSRRNKKKEHRRQRRSGDLDTVLVSEDLEKLPSVYRKGSKSKNMKEEFPWANDVDTEFYAENLEDPAVPFQRHETNTVLTGYPTIYMTEQVADDMQCLVDINSEEVGWMGTVEKHLDGYLITEIFLLKQEVSNAQTEISEDGLAELSEELLKAGDEGMKRLNSLKFWGHSHVRMGISPSGQDDKQMEDLRESGHDFFIRGICNKLGALKFDFYYFNVGITITDVPWAILRAPNEERLEYWKKENKEKVKAGGYKYYKGGFHGYTPAVGYQPHHNGNTKPDAEGSSARAVLYYEPDYSESEFSAGPPMANTKYHGPSRYSDH